jgi:hypothetical protein
MNRLRVGADLARASGHPYPPRHDNVPIMHDLPDLGERCTVWGECCLREGLWLMVTGVTEDGLASPVDEGTPQGGRSRPS